MKTNTEFNHNFSKKRFRDDNKLYYQIVTFVIIFTILSVSLVANLDYSKYRSSYKEVIKKRYVNLITKLLVEAPKPPVETVSGDLNKDHTLSPEEKLALEKKMAERSAQKSAYIGSFIRDKYVDLSEFEDNDISEDDILIEELTRESKKPGSTYNRGIPVRRKMDKMRKYSSVYDLINHPFEYNLSRRGVMYINVTDELLQEPETEQLGYRDPNEISRVVSAHLPMIEYCFQKARRINRNVRGYVKLEFRISYEGYVIPESIRVLSSTINDPKVEACIKKTVKRWRDFKKLDQKMGIVRTVQKFAFN